jgi:hypothetical protein
MEQNLTIDDAGAKVMEREYIGHLSAAAEIFDGKPFRLSNSPEGRPSESMYDAVMIAIDNLWSRRLNLIKAKSQIQSRYWSALDSPEKIERFSGRANTAEDVRTRIASMTTLFRTALRDAGL